MKTPAHPSIKTSNQSMPTAAALSVRELGAALDKANARLAELESGKTQPKHLARLNALQGAERTAYYNKHRGEIRRAIAQAASPDSTIV